MTRHVDEGHQQHSPRDAVTVPTPRRDVDEPDEVERDGGDPSCWAHLLCPHCGAVSLDETASCDCVRPIEVDVEANLAGPAAPRGRVAVNGPLERGARPGA